MGLEEQVIWAREFRLTPGSPTTLPGLDTGVLLVPGRVPNWRGGTPRLTLRDLILRGARTKLRPSCLHEMVIKTVEVGDVPHKDRQRLHHVHPAHLARTLGLTAPCNGPRRGAPMALPPGLPTPPIAPA